MFNQNKLISNLSLRLLANFASKGLGLLTLPIISRALGPVQYGQWNFLLSILGYASIPFTAGIVTYGVREVAKENKNIVNFVISGRLILFILSFFVGLLVTLYYVKLNSTFFISYLISSIYLFSIAINIEFYYIGKNNFKTPFTAQLCGQILYVIMVLALIKYENNFILLTAIYGVYYLITSLILLKKYTSENKLRITLKLNQAKLLLKNSYRIGISGIIENLSVSLPIILISIFLNNYFTGVYAASFKLVAIIILLIQTIITVLSPKLVKLKYESNKIIINTIVKSIIYFLAIGTSIAITTNLFNKEIIETVYGANYSDSSLLLKMFTYVYIPILPLGMYLNSILLYFEKDKQYLLNTLICSATLLITLPIFINYYFINGAIYGMSIYMLLYSFIPLIQLKSVIKKN